MGKKVTRRVSKFCLHTRPKHMNLLQMRFLLNLPSVIFNKSLNKLPTKSCRNIHQTKMACSKYEYVKNFEACDKIVPNTWIVVRIDGKGFHKFSRKHNFEKPNDRNGNL